MNEPKILVTKSDVDEALARLADQLITTNEQKPLYVALLRGAAPFASKLMFAIAERDPTYHPELDYMMVSTYGDGRTAGTPRVVTDLAPDTKH